MNRPVNFIYLQISLEGNNSTDEIRSYFKPIIIESIREMLRIGVHSLDKEYESLVFLDVT